MHRHILYIVFELAVHRKALFGGVFQESRFKLALYIGGINRVLDLAVIKIGNYGFCVLVDTVGSDDVFKHGIKKALVNITSTAV